MPSNNQKLDPDQMKTLTNPMANAAFVQPLSGRLWNYVPNAKTLPQLYEGVISRQMTALSVVELTKARNQGILALKAKREKEAHEKKLLPIERHYNLRVTLNGITCHNQTWDTILETDGKRDEVWVESDVQVTDGTGTVLTQSNRRSVVMGDTGADPNRSAFPGRLRVVGGTPDHPEPGIGTGNHVPATEPWRRSGPGQKDRFPLTLFSATDRLPLTRGLVITPTIMEWDDGGDIVSDWGGALAREGGSIVGAIVNLLKNPETGMVVKSALDLGLPAMLRFAVGIFGRNGSRPIGTREVTDNNYEFHPQVVGMRPEAIPIIASQDFGFGPGVYALRYQDAPRLAGDYSLYLQVEYGEFDYDPNPHVPV